MGWIKNIFGGSQAAETDYYDDYRRTEQIRDEQQRRDTLDRQRDYDDRYIQEQQQRDAADRYRDVQRRYDNDYRGGY